MIMIIPSIMMYGQENGKKTSGMLLLQANHCFEKHEYDSAVSLYKNFLDSHSSLQEKKNKETRQNKNVNARVSLQIGNIYMMEEQYTLAEFWYRKAMDIVDSLPVLQAEIFQDIGSLYFFKEHYEYAIIYYQKSYILYSQNPVLKPDKLADLLINLGAAYSEGGEFLKSYSCFQKADSILKRNKESVQLQLAGLDVNLGEILLKMDSPTKAIKSYKSACKLATGNDISSKNISFSSFLGMAECYSQFKEVDSAMHSLEDCFKLIDKTDRNALRDSARIFLFMGDVQAQNSEWERSIEFYQRALEILSPDPTELNKLEKDPGRNEDDLLDLYKIYSHMGQSLLKLSIHSNSDTVALYHSFSAFILALKICDHISKDFGQGPSMLAIHESAKSILAGALESGFLLKAKRSEKDFYDLFLLADENKNRLLLEGTRENRFLSQSDVSDSLKSTISRIKDEIVFYSRKYIKEGSILGFCSIPDLNDMLNKVTGLKLKLDSLRKNIGEQTIDKNYAVSHQKKSNPSRITNCLNQDEAMLEYFCSDSIIYIFIVSKEGSSMERVAVPATFHNTLSECMNHLKGAEMRNFPSLSHNLYNYLVAPVESWLKNIHRLIIIPDEELSLFPFETLISENKDEDSVINSPSLHYLLRDFEISYHFSAECWFSDTLNNALQTNDFRFAGFAPGFSDTHNNQISLTPLPYSLKEVTTIANLFTHPHSHHPTFLGSAATEKNFRTYAPGNSHIHIATHSIISVEDPVNSALVFSGIDEAGSLKDKNDGLLHLDEISNLQLNAELVVLSACATGKGKVSKTEGIFAFTRSFYLAGVSNVVYSLWNIPDHLTSNFMVDFYKAYFSGKSYAAALREVKLKMISNPETSLPYEWAGVVLLGRN
jgi:CHAT domain-containing protein/tetratricopeptide (TPR) repeat protein